MKAAFFKEHGGTDKILCADYQDPQMGPGDVLVRVEACGLNHVDLLLLDGRYPPPLGLPHVNGCDAAGRVARVGREVAGVAEGQRVVVFPGFSCGRCEYCRRGERTVCLRYGYLGAARDGGQAEYVAVPAGNVVALPEGVSGRHAAASAMTTLTSWHAVVAQARLDPGQTVLVQAAGSGVGSTAIQVAKLCHARVITTVGSDDKIDFARSVGADEVINYRTHNFVEEVKRLTDKRGVDLVIEHIGADTFERSVYCLARLGKLVTIGSHADHWGRVDLRHVYSKNLRIIGTNLGTIDELHAILRHMQAGRLLPPIDRVYPLAEARQAVTYLAERRNRGKVLLEPEG
ncbi:MAG: zinc-binding dehydrogenase [Candidatus Rokubacteria bacterium]|nr:zinc-binding dehydrogenase [Candidatus Rokubacteria bacterium]MBI3109101.1 zinc-binding dehydrogenase [Candidatus Rokubacteria bacterium]